MKFFYRISAKITLATVLTSSAVWQASGQTLSSNILDTASTPTVFAQGTVSTPFGEWSTSFTPDGKTVYFCRGDSYWTICYSKYVNGKWIRPEVAEFSGKYNDTDPFVSPDGKKLFFISNRPQDGNGEMPQKNYHIWYVDRLSANQWSTPKHIDGPVNLEGSNNYAPSVSSAGTLFFCSRNREGNKGMGSYAAKWLGDHFDQPKQLVLLGKEDVQDPFSAPDESYIIFLSGKDIYYCPKNGNEWGTAEKLGPQVNNGDPNSSPYVSRDGKTLYYTSSRTKGFYVRNVKGKSLNYDELEAECQSIFNSEGNILMIPIHNLKTTK